MSKPLIYIQENPNGFVMMAIAMSEEDARTIMDDKFVGYRRDLPLQTLPFELGVAYIYVTPLD